MTAKQRAARAKFKAVVAEAKKLRKKNPKLTQAQAVKQAFAINYDKAGKKKIGYSKARQTVNKNATAWLKNRKYTGKDEGESKKQKIEKAYLLAPYGKPQQAIGKIKKKAATKVKAKKSRSTEMHTDTKSHNVNIRVVSGIDSDVMQKYNSVVKNINGLETALLRNKETAKKFQYKTPFWKQYFANQNKKIKKYITELKKHKAELKKLM
jgi:hypothetical protein